MFSDLCRIRPVRPSLPPYVQSEVEAERRRRIVVAAWAWAYEVESRPIVDDATYDREASLIRPEIDTGNMVLDEFFRTQFAAHTGSWVNSHPGKDRLPRICAIMRGER